ncbi:bifunctional 3-(3-hydroxy-phenyl)propionate/3-hydroxycinnamic acid hydroxylase [Aquirhabdus sp.]|uniref:bifunctional 3-(3-hydroxy-phenyl)propionate/3-hydroxycinnamic acid hydroxylase MhpA n=1 Tax=Aquirhabdus sp. TaxID=2824160 RepID=UPI00396C985F
MTTSNVIPLPDKTDILIVGYGPVGAALAALLGRYGVQALVIDKATDVLLMPRAIALDNEALRILQMIGLADDAFEKIIIPEVKMHSPYVRQFGRVNATGTIDGHPKLVTFYQPDLEHALRKQVERYPQVQCYGGLVLVDFVQDDAGVIATVANEQGDRATVRAQYLVGADGASSKVRSLIGQDFQGQTYAEDWLIVDVNNRRGKAIDHVEFICDPHRPTPHMPAPGGRERWEFMLQPGETREEMEHPDRIAELLAPWIDAKELTIERTAVYRFHARCCNRFQQDRVFLIGDAAHITPPFVGQGLVAGLRDAANLGWKLAWVSQGKAVAHILDSYDQERRPHAKKMIELAKFMGHMVMPSNALLAVAIHGVMKTIRLLPAARAFFEELKIKPANRFQHGLFIKGSAKSGLQRGGQIPQGRLHLQNLESSFSDDVLGDAFTLIGVGIDPQSLLGAATTAHWQHAGGRFLHIAKADTKTDPIGATQGSDTVTALDGFMAAIPSGWLVITRPDRVVMLDGSSTQANSLVNQCLKMINGSIFFMMCS